MKEKRSIIVKTILLFILTIGYIKTIDVWKVMKFFSRDIIVPTFTLKDPNFIYSLQNKLYFVLVPTLLFLFLYFFYTKGFNKKTALIIIKLLSRYLMFLFAVILGYFTSLILIKDISFSPPEIKSTILVVFIITGFLYFTIYDILGKK